jgi:hypothetical protein
MPMIVQKQNGVNLLRYRLFYPSSPSYGNIQFFFQILNFHQLTPYFENPLMNVGRQTVEIKCLYLTPNQIGGHLKIMAHNLNGRHIG